ncbi:stage V sporulation protein K [Diaporthe helianthi]|uniref:Stage V sporulation protein K n=1 Tax=Diaporthe helianthi TaxID=158607 RepID=A0A2P5I884_DIAHE|nr:stage V sporulation protein K [Diaporthe helianthi]
MPPLTNSTDSARARHLSHLLHGVLNGNRKLQSLKDVRLFFEAVQIQPALSSCIEAIVASKHGIEALQLAARIDLSVSFMCTHTLPFLAYLQDDQLKMLAGGQILQRALVAFAKPPTFWNGLVAAAQSGALDEDALRVFAWFCLELLSLPEAADIDVVADVSSIADSKRFIEASSPETRKIGYKIQHLLQLRTSRTSTSTDGYGPGGRHDNDFVDFRKVAVYPTTDEFLSTERPFFRRAREVFEVEMAERAAVHLDNTYRLTREDLLGELRNDWQIAQGRKRGRRSALTLRELRPAFLELGNEIVRKKCSLALRCFSGLEELEKKHMQPEARKKWLEDNRNYLRHQSFGALYRGQEIFGFAFVDRDIEGLLQSPPVVILQFTDDRALSKALLALKMMPDIMFTLVDTPVFAYEPVLERLKDMKELPLQEQLLDASGAADDFVPQPPIQDITERLSSGGAHVPVRNGLINKKFQLDSSQRHSLINALSRKVSVIQGPPGTGKSFIGALATHFFVQDTSCRILVITYTNHALDQFLEDLLGLGIPEESMVRLGSKSTPRTGPLLLSKQQSGYRRGKGAWAIIDDLKVDAAVQSTELRDAFTSYQQPQTFRDLQEHLEFSEEDSHFYEAFLIPAEKDGFKKVGKKGKAVTEDYLYNRWVRNEGPGMFGKHALENHRSVWDIQPALRAKYVEKWFSAILKEKVERVQELARQYDLLQDRMDTQFAESKVSILREKRIIGCTTTAAAKYTEIITSAQPDVVIVEEAGEIQESHILTALTPSVKQVIQIGDHKQLRPKINNYKLTVEKGDGYDLNRSMFERLILQGHPHTTLRKQHRMHPDISLLVRELTYPDLEDDPKTSTRDPIRGLDDRVIFVNHSHPELQNERIADRRDEGSKSSKENDFEARMVLKTVRFLAQQGYGTKNMVVLTPYLGQLRLVRDMLMDDVDPVLSDLDSHELIQAGLMTKAAAKVDKSPLRISTIDNYQGEEADIVIVSLTRSNNNGDIGFLAARERLNVLLSRARNCLVMFGNMETYMHSKKGADTWNPFFKLMKANNYIHDGLPVKCEKHPDRRFLLKEPDDFDVCCPDGGCAEQCDAPLNCGLHNCTMRCHRVDDHSKMPCPHHVERSCDRGHKLKMPCHMRNKKCHKCAQEDLETERRVKRDLKLEAERQAREAAYQRELAEIRDEIDHERRILRYTKDKEDQQKTLAQQRADLDALRKTAERVLNTTKKQAKQSMPGSFPGSDHNPPTPPTEEDSSDSLKDLPDGAAQEWKHLKQYEGAKSKPLDELMGMIGLEEVKSEFLSVKSKVDTAIRQGVSLAKERFGCSMLGNPGTGKTTVARIYAQFLTSLGVIPGSCFKEETGASLANAGVSGCKAIIDEILDNGGGVLFIDEAYQLTSGNNFGGGAVLDYLLPEVENLNGKVIFILAGYRKQMESFYAHNPGLPSRFPIEMRFDDYTDAELLHIFELKMHNKYDGRMKCEDGPRGLYSRIVTRRVGRGRGREGFGNARTIENTLAMVSSRQATRLGKERRQGKKPDDFLFTKEDIIGPEPTEALTKCAAWKQLQGLFGLKAVKEAVQSLVDSVKQNYTRELDEQPPIEYSLNRVFFGNPGTGKTTVAKLYGAILVDLGLLSKGEVIVKNPSDFVGSVLGQSEKQTKGILAASLGKVLVIDEAYGLYGGQGSTADPYKSAVIDTIVAEVQSVPGDDRCVLLLGYKEQMETMFQNVNPGLSRRFPIASAFEFEDFDDDALRQILKMKLKKQGYHATDQAQRVAMDMLSRARNRPNFGNAGEIDIMLDAAKAKHQSRLSRKETSSASTLEAPEFDENFDRAERAETNVSMLFEGTVGQEDVIAKLQGYQETVKTMKSLELDPKEDIPFNFLFRGPPGTGKTTTAKKMGKVFYDMGFLATAEVVECSATDLIGQYVGQTGPKVQGKLDTALGKVLFIDEAYRLAEGHFAKEAMDELVDAATKDKYVKKLIIILAGYEKDINRLMTTNPGLTSRFPEVIDFRPLQADECVELLLHSLKAHKSRLSGPKSKKKVDLDVSVLEPLEKSLGAKLNYLFTELAKQESWASARDVKTLAKSIFNVVIQDKKGIEKGYLKVREDVVEAELTKMLHERASRSVDQSRRFPSVLDESAFQMPPPVGRPNIETQTTHSVTSDYSDPPEHKEDPKKKPAAIKQRKQRSTKREATRDAGVSDAVWEQLQKDKKAEERREQEYQSLLKAQRSASDEARDEIVRRLLEEEERRRKEEEARKKLEENGVCPAGFAWIKQAGGYRCGGGSHYMSDDTLMQL